MRVPLRISRGLRSPPEFFLFLQAYRGVSVTHLSLWSTSTFLDCTCSFIRLVTLLPSSLQRPSNRACITPLYIYTQRCRPGTLREASARLRKRSSFSPPAPAFFTWLFSRCQIRYKHSGVACSPVAVVCDRVRSGARTPKRAFYVSTRGSTSTRKAVAPQLQCICRVAPSFISIMQE